MKAYRHPGEDCAYVLTDDDLLYELDDMGAVLVTDFFGDSHEPNFREGVLWGADEVPLDSLGDLVVYLDALGGKQ